MKLLLGGNIILILVAHEKKQNKEINKVPFNNDAGDGFTSNSKITNR